MKRNKFTCAGISIMLLFLAACSKNDNTYSLSTADENFVVQATYASLGEITAGLLASSQAQKDSVKMFGTLMVTDHRKAHHTLDSIGQVLRFTIPGTTDQEHLNMVQELTPLTGKQFDSSYMAGQVRDHQKTITLFETEAATGNQALLKDFATKLLPALRMHLALADSIRKKL